MVSPDVDLRVGGRTGSPQQRAGQEKSVELTAVLAKYLHRFNADPTAGESLAAELGALSRDVLHAVPSCLAVTLLLARFGGDVVLTAATALPEGLPVLASLAVPLADQPHQAATLILRAGQAGAFLLLADDLGAGLAPPHLGTPHSGTPHSGTPHSGTRQPALQVDQHLTMPPADSGGALATTLSDLSTVNQALGVLFARGLAPEAARRELQRLAATANVTLAVAARRLLAPRPAGPA